jgi:dienelactone hydrolase
MLIRLASFLLIVGQEHGFDSNGDAAAAKDAWQRMLAFFDRHLGKGR